MPKQRRWVQRKLTFDTYVKRNTSGPSLEDERRQERERHLKDIQRRLEEADTTLEEAKITYEPKRLKKKEKISDVQNENDKYCPWGDLPEMYPGQHLGKAPDYEHQLLYINGKSIVNIYDTAEVEQQQQIRENLKTYINLHTENAVWKIPQEVEQLWNRISEK